MRVAEQIEKIRRREDLQVRTDTHHLYLQLNTTILQVSQEESKVSFLIAMDKSYPLSAPRVYLRS